MADTERIDPRDLVGWGEVFKNIETDEFNELALFAGGVSGSPMSLVPLVDENRHWFTSVTGAHLTAGPWEQMFCAHGRGATGRIRGAHALRDPRLFQQFCRSGQSSAPTIRLDWTRPLECEADCEPARRGTECEPANDGWLGVRFIAAAARARRSRRAGVNHMRVFPGGRVRRW